MIDPKIYQPLANLNLWFKIKAGDPLTLADVPKIIPLRWTFFRDNFSFIRKNISSKISESVDPDQLDQQLESLDDFILEQKSSVILRNSNPFIDKNIFYRFYMVFDNILISSLPVSEEEQRILDETIEDVTSFSRNTFIELRHQIIEAKDLIADQAGLSDDTYNSIKKRISVSREIPADYSVLVKLKSFQDAIKSVDFIIANEYNGNNSKIDPFAVTRANLAGSGLSIGNYKSGYLVPFNYGDTLERIAYRYLGSQDKWMDIAIANGLKPPYVDEVGFSINLKATGYKNTIIIDGLSGIEDNIKRLYLNQSVFLTSASIKFAEQRTIIGIRQVDASSLVLELSGDPDLERFVLADEPKIRAFKAETINSNFFILIPTEGEIQPSLAQLPSFLENLAPDEKNAKVDLALSDTGDFQFTSTGDFKLSFGLANALQALKLKLSVELGSLRRHPNYGLVNVLGESSADVTAIIKAMSQSIDEQVQADPRFERVETLNIFYKEATIEVELSVRLAGSGAIVPIVFRVT